MIEWLKEYGWAVWGVSGGVLYLLYRIRRYGRGQVVRRDPQKYSDQAIIRQMKIVAVGLVMIFCALAIGKFTAK